jgi:DNA-binding transcriptional regulator YiaG
MDPTREPEALDDGGGRRDTGQAIAVAAGAGLAAGLLATGHRTTAASVAIGTAAAAAVGMAFPDLVAKIRAEWGLGRREFSRLVGYSERVIADWEKGKTLSAHARRRIIEVERLRRSLVTALGELVQPDVIPEWLRTPNPAFGGSTPLQVMERGETDRIWNMIYELGSGMPN